MTSNLYQINIVVKNNFFKKNNYKTWRKCKNLCEVSQDLGGQYLPSEKKSALE